jgi:hypothetical protein
MNRFIQRFDDKIMGVLSGFDRLVLRGTLRPIAYPRGMLGYLWERQVLLKDWGSYVLEVCQRLREATSKRAEQLKRPIVYLNSSKIDKAQIAEEIVIRDQIQEGLIAVLSCVEWCMGYAVAKNRETKRIELIQRQRKCLFLYHYLFHPEFGFMNARIQSWFPFNIQICLNGREWLSRQMDRAGIKYQKRENCFVWIEDVKEAQKLMDQQLRIHWPKALKQIAESINLIHPEIVEGLSFPMDYYWSTFESEWATDIMFRDPSDLAAIYRRLVLHGITTFCSADVMRFLGKRLRCDSEIDIMSDYKIRPEGVRIKHRAGANSLKLYDKMLNLLRAEATINNPKVFAVYRRAENKPDSALRWRPLRRGIADMHRLAQVSQACNDRYLDALSSVDTSIPLGKLYERICSRTNWNGKSIRALNPTSKEDLRLFEAVSHGEFALNGFRNRDIRAILYGPDPESAAEQRRRSTRVTRMIRILRAHHLLQKVPRTHRYHLTPLGRDIISAALSAQKITLEQLNRAA